MKNFFQIFAFLIACLFAWNVMADGHEVGELKDALADLEERLK